jgi:hypothetical protein
MSLAPGKILSRCLLAGLLAGGGIHGGCVSRLSPPLDLSGRPVDPFVNSLTAATVLIFVSDDCPISNRYVPEIRRLQETFSPRRVSFWLVHADPRETSADIREHWRQFDLTLPAVRDPDHFLVHLAHAEVTPTAAVFAPGRTLVYHGRIDDRVSELQRERPEPEHRDLAEALEAVLAGRPVPVAATPAIGCFIPGPR